MKRLLRQILLAAAGLTVLAAWALPAAAGAWVQEKDGYYFKVSASYLSTDSEFNARGDEVAILSGDTLLTDTSYRDVGVSAYVEYGLAPRLTLVGTLPFKVLTSERTELSNELEGFSRDVEAVNGGFGDLGVGARYAVLSEPFPLSLQAMFKLPLGYENVPDNGGPPLGSGKPDLEGHILAGKSLWPFPGYVTGGIGYRLRGGSLSDEFLFAAEAGASWRRLTARVGIDALYSTTDPPDLSRSGTNRVSSAIVVTNQDILKLSPGLMVAINDEVAVTFDVFHTLEGRNTVSGTTWALGISFKE